MIKTMRSYREKYWFQWETMEYISPCNNNLLQDFVAGKIVLTAGYVTKMQLGFFSKEITKYVLSTNNVVDKKPDVFYNKLLSHFVIK